MAKGLPPHVHRKRAKGRTYYYFDTGTKKDGKPILKRMPELGTPQFGPAYSAALNGRSRRMTTAAELTVRAMADLWQRSPEFRRKADNTQRVYVRYLETVSNGLGPAPAEKLERRDVIALIDGMGERTGAANMVLAVIGSLYSWGRKRGHVTTYPTRDIDAFDSVDYEPWPEALVEAALIDDDKVVRLATALLYFTAQRIGDVLRMRWNDIQDGVLLVTQQKTKIELQIPVHTRLKAILGPKEALTILHHGGKPFAQNTIRLRLQAWAKERGYHVVPHGLRKNAVNALLEAGCSAAETASISGQSLQMVEHYAKRRNTGRLASAAILKWQDRA